MKILIVALGLCCYTLSAYSLNISYQYTYDDNGNRLSWVFIDVPNLVRESLIDENTEILREDFIPTAIHEDVLQGAKISIFPNPSRGELIARIESMTENLLGKISVFDIRWKSVNVISELREYNSVCGFNLS